MIWTAQLAVLAAAAQLAGAGAAPIVLVCSIPRSEPFAPAATVPKLERRTFRIGPGSFEEWSERDGRYGPNLCAAVRCHASPERSEGTIGTASVVYTVGLDRRSGAGYWRVVGATGFRQTEGVCRQGSDPGK